MATAFVTGVNGFIGSHLAKHLLESGDEVVGLVRPTSDLRPLQQLFVDHPDSFRLVVGDLRTGEGLEAGLHGASYVYHLGAVIMGTSEEEFRTANTDGTRRLLEEIERVCGDRLLRFVMTSSQAAAGPAPSPEPIDEQAPPQPVSWYGASKRDAEVIVAEFAAHGRPVTIVRPVAVYGERERDISGGSFPSVNLGLSPRIGLRSKTVSTVYVGELVRGMVMAAKNPGTVGKTYFMADPEPLSAKQLVAAIATALGRRVRIPVIIPHFALWAVAIFAELGRRFFRMRPMVTRDKVREMRRRFWSASPAAAERDFGWVAAVPLDEGMLRAVTDWRQRRRAASLVNEPTRDRALKTFILALVFGAGIEGFAAAANWYRFQPTWLIVISIVVFFGGVYGAIALTTAGRGLLQFVAGAAAFAAVELANHFWLGLWVFAPYPFGNLDTWLRVSVLSAAMGFVPIAINAVIGWLYQLRRRLG